MPADPAPDTRPATMPPHPHISICIPCHGMAGQGRTFLRQALDSIARQTFKDLEVIVADQSDDRGIADLCQGFAGLNLHRLETRHEKRQASANTNAAINAARGDIIKVLFQDDFLNEPKAMEKLSAAFTNPATGWCLTGSERPRYGRTRFKRLVPRYHDRIHFGKNTVSSPSVLAFRNTAKLRFDENLVWLMDVDFYKRCEMMLGQPGIIPEPLVVNRLHAAQVSAGVNAPLVRRELRYIRDKYRAHMTWGDWLHYLGRLGKTFL